MTARNGKIEAALRELRKDPSLSVSAAAKANGVNRRTLQDHWSKEKPVVLDVKNSKGADMLESAGLDPAEWAIKQIAATGSPDSAPAIKVTAVPRESLDLAAVTRGPLPKPQPPKRADRSLAFCGDHHAPHHDQDLHAAFLSFLSDEQPGFLGVLGDMGDYATISRHRAGPGFRQGVAQANQAIYDILRDYREASPDSEIVLLPGNHDARIEFYLQDRAPELLEVGPAYQEDVPALDLRRLWRLDELGIMMPEGSWETANWKVTPSLTMRHGYQTAKNNGEGMLNKHGRSAIQGHDHRLRMTFKTKHDPTDVRVAVSAGMMGKVEPDGLGYSAEPDWQAGFVYGHAWKNGDFALMPVPWMAGRGLLLADGRRYTP